MPLSYYMIYHLFTPKGVMQNYKASAGAYGYSAMNFLNAPRSQTQVWRPEIDFVEQSASLTMYSKRIEEKKASGDLPEGLHHPRVWY